MGICNLFDRINYHKVLCRDVWPTDDFMDERVRAALLAVVAEFFKYMRGIGFNITDDDIVDIFVHGSITNYYYDAHSDIDVCIVADCTELRKQLGELKVGSIVNMLIRSWLSGFKFDIKGRHLDIVLRDVNAHKPFDLGYYDKVGPAYSIKNNEWVIRPTRLNDREVKSIVQAARVRAREILRNFHKCLTNGESVGNFFQEIQGKRKASMNAQYWQPLTPETAAFKLVRNRGMMRKIGKLSKIQRAKPFNVK